MKTRRRSILALAPTVARDPTLAFTAALALTAALAVACGEGLPPSDEELAAVTPVPPGAAPAEPGRELAEVDLCRLLPVEEVAEITGQRLAGAAQRQNMGASQGCTYGVALVTGGASADRLSVWAQPPSLFEDSEAIVATARGLGHEVEVQPVVGLGERAFLIADTTGGTFTVHVLREGDLALRATAGQPEHAVAMAQLALQRLGLPVSSGEVAAAAE